MLIPVHKKKPKLNGLDKYVIFSISTMVIYTAVSLTILVLTGYTYETLLVCLDSLVVR